MIVDQQKFRREAYSGSAILLVFVIFSMVTLSVLVGSRDISVGSDTKNYARFFEMILSGREHGRFEPGFSMLSNFISKITSNIFWYFFILYSMLTITYIRSSILFIGGLRSNFDILYVIGFSLASSWYQAASINGLRQGLSLSFLYLSIYYFTKKRYWLFIAIFVISLGFHFSSILIFPFLFLLFFNEKIVFLAFIFSSFMYASGISEYLLEYVSVLAGLSFYNDVVEYNSTSEMWIGFQLNFFIYTLVVGVVSFTFKSFVSAEFYDRYIGCWKAYCILMLPYFYFAHGAYSNRYAFIGWLFIPILLTVSAAFCRVSLPVRAFMSFVVFCLGMFLFLVEIRML